MPKIGSLDLWILMPLFLLSIVLLLISLQFNEPTASAYKDMVIITFAFYGIALSRGFASWLGLGERRNLGLGALLGIGLYGVTVLLGAVIGVPLAIGSSEILNLFYRFFSAVFIETGLFFAIIYPTFKGMLRGNAFSASILTAVFWAGFHIVALQGNPGQLVGLVVVGVLYCMANEYAKSVMPSLVGHGLWNLTKVLNL